MHENPVMVLKCCHEFVIWAMHDTCTAAHLVDIAQCTLHIAHFHCTLHIVHFHCTLHIFLHIANFHCTLYIFIAHCTYYPFPQEMISFWTLFTSHNSEKYEKVLRKNSKDGFAEKYSSQCVFVFLLVCIVLFYLKHADR